MTDGTLSPLIIIVWLDSSWFKLLAWDRCLNLGWREAPISACDLQLSGSLGTLALSHEIVFGKTAHGGVGGAKARGGLITFSLVTFSPVLSYSRGRLLVWVPSCQAEGEFEKGSTTSQVSALATWLWDILIWVSHLLLTNWIICNWGRENYSIVQWLRHSPDRWEIPVHTPSLQLAAGGFQLGGLWHPSWVS